MAEEKIKGKEVLEENELEQVTGGARGYIYYMGDREQGGYTALKSSYKLSEVEILTALERARVLDERDLKDEFDGRFHVPERDAQMVLDNMRARGYEFINCDNLYRHTILSY